MIWRAARPLMNFLTGLTGLADSLVAVLTLGLLGSSFTFRTVCALELRRIRRSAAP